MMKSKLFLLIFTVQVLSGYLNAKAGFDPSRDINIAAFGAKPDGATDNTTIIQKAIDHCAEAGGGTVYFPAGTYMAGSIFLKDHVTLELHQSAILKGIDSQEAYPGPYMTEKGFIRIDGVSDVSIVGEGTIDGSGDSAAFQKGNNGHGRPFAVFCRGSKNVVIKDIHIRNSAFWTLRLFENDGVRIDGVSIYSHSNWNNDGIDIDSKNVTISNCRIDCDDDAICFKSDGKTLCENVAVTNCNLASNCNLIKFGTASIGGFKNIAVSNCVLHTASESKLRKWNTIIDGVSEPITGISGIALEVVDGGMMDQVTITNITMTGVQTPVFMRLGSRRNPTGSLKNVIISNVLATTQSRIPSCISGVPGFYIENVVIRDMIVNCMGGASPEDAARNVPENEKGYPENRMFGNTLPAYGMYLRHAKNVTLDNIQFNLMNPDPRPAILFDDVQEATLRAFRATPPSGNQELIVNQQSAVKILN